MNLDDFVKFLDDYNWPTDRMVNDYISELNADLDQLLKDCAEATKVKIPSSEIEDIMDRALDNLIVGNWFLLRHGGHLYISKEKPLRIDSKNWTLEGLDHSGWMQLDEDGNTFWKAPYSALKREDFNRLELPEIVEEDSPIEIEIMKSGNVYYYES